jgi:V8-like Glu-specific endopeptidase
MRYFCDIISERVESGFGIFFYCPELTKGLFKDILISVGHHCDGKTHHGRGLQSLIPLIALEIPVYRQFKGRWKSIKGGNVEIMGRMSDRRALHRIASVAIISLFTVTVAASTIWSQAHPPPSLEVEINIDSGILTNEGKEAQVVWSTIVEVPEATWLRLHFETVQLANDPTHLESSVIRTTSMLDSAVQHLNSTTCEQWQNSTAYFNGDKLLVELIAIPGAQENRVVISNATAGLPDIGNIDTICGPTDDRILSYTQRDCRVMPVGCSGFIIDDAHHQFMTAGHCSNISVAEFNVPLSLSNGTLVHPGPEDQYAVDGTSRQYQNGGIGSDWAYFGCYPNTETGLTAFMAGGEYYTLADEAPPVMDQTIRITGYGTVSYPIPLEWNQVQKTHTGPYWDQTGTRVQYRTDTTGGNSGSVVFNEDEGEAIGVHTHGGCTNTGGANSGTAVHNSNLVAALANPRGICAPFDLTVTNLVGGETARLTASGATPGETVFFGFSISGEGEVPIDPLGVIVGISDPRSIGSAVADPSGTAILDHPISPFASGRRVWIQAAHVGMTSTVVERVVQ